eukprot:gene32781-40463_t
MILTHQLTCDSRAVQCTCGVTVKSVELAAHVAICSATPSECPLFLAFQSCAAGCDGHSTRGELKTHLGVHGDRLIAMIELNKQLKLSNTECIASVCHLQTELHAQKQVVSTLTAENAHQKDQITELTSQWAESLTALSDQAALFETQSRSQIAAMDKSNQELSQYVYKVERALESEAKAVENEKKRKLECLSESATQTDFSSQPPLLTRIYYALFGEPVALAPV